MDLKIRSIALLFVLSLFSACDHDDDADVVPDTRVTIAGKKYPTITIGAQSWTSVNYAGPGGIAYDDQNSKPEYGKYYTKAELTSILLPDGWRIPNQQDYKALAQVHGITLPSHGTETEKINPLISKTNWNNASGTNVSGFNAYPAGYTFGAGPPMDGDIAEFWTSEGATLSIQEAGLNLTALRMVFYQSDDSPEYRFNVRFVKD